LAYEVVPSLLPSASAQALGQMPSRGFATRFTALGGETWGARCRNHASGPARASPGPGRAVGTPAWLMGSAALKPGFAC
jgi:hypothetical protein